MIAARLKRETEFGLQALPAHFQQLASNLPPGVTRVRQPSGRSL
jgi:hypothetical protein